MDSIFARIMYMLVGFTMFAFGFVFGAVMANEGHIQFPKHQAVVSCTKQDKYSSIDELIKEVLKEPQ